MKFTCLQENLSKVLVRSVRLLPGKPQSPDQSLIHLVAEDGELTSQIRNPFASFSTKTQGSMDKPGSIAVPAKELSSIISSIQPGKVELTATEGALQVKSGSFKARLLSGEWIDRTPNNDGGKSIVITRDEFSRVIGLGGLAAGVDESRPAFSSLLFEIEQDGLAIVSTDGFRLSRAVAAITVSGDGSKKPKKRSDETKKDGAEPATRLILSAKLAREGVKTVLESAGDQVALRFQDSSLSLSSASTELTLSALEVEYPNYQAIIPKGHQHSVSLSADELQSALRAVTALDKVGSRQQIVQFVLSEKNLLVKSLHSESGEAEAEISAEVVRERGEEKKDFTIAFNSTFLFPMVGALAGEQIEILLSDPLQPATVRRSLNDSFLYVVMPFRSSSGS